MSKMEPELDSPPFTPKELDDFAARGYNRTVPPHPLVRKALEAAQYWLDHRHEYVYAEDAPRLAAVLLRFLRANCSTLDYDLEVIDRLADGLEK